MKASANRLLHVRFLRSIYTNGLHYRNVLLLSELFHKNFRTSKNAAAFHSFGCQRNRVSNAKKVNNLPVEAEAVVIGAGSVGCSTAYHLSKLLKGNVVLLEKHKVTSGTTWHTAGILWCFKPSEAETIMQIQSRDLISEILPSINGHSAGWTQTGGLHTFKSSEDYKSFIQSLPFARNLDVKLMEVKPSDIPDLHSLVRTDDVHVAVYSPGDGIMDPSTLCMSYVKAAIKFGAKVVENCNVTNLLAKDDDFGIKRIAGVETNQGTIKTNIVINCAGAWAPYIAEMVGVRIPQLTFKHAYVVTESIPGIQGTPLVKDHGSVYIKPQGSALHFGGYEMNPHLVQNLPLDFSFGLYDLDWEIFQPHYEGAVNRIPQIQKTGIRSTVCGPESFTPDGKPNIGETPSVRGFFVGCGFNSGGMMLGGGAGRQLAHWVFNGKPEIDLFNCDIRRYPTCFSNYNKWLLETCHGKFAKRYGLVYKYDHSLSGRNQRLGPLHEVHRKHGALFGSKNGFERPAYYVIDSSGKPDTNLEVLPYDFYGCYGNEKHKSYPYCDEVFNDCTYGYPPKSHRLIGRECLTCRTAAAIFDTSSMSKYFVSGPDMDLVMKRVFSRNVTNADVRQFFYALLLNEDGGIEGDAIVTKWKSVGEENGYYITTATSAEQYCLAHIRRIIADAKWNCKIDNITEHRAIMSIQGPNSAKWLASVIEDVTFPVLRYGEWNDVHIAGKHAILGRLSFVGELGYEIHCQRDDALQIHSALMDKAPQYQACMAGYRAMESLSCETGFHHWSHAIKSSDNPVEAGLTKFCDDTDVYVGADAIRRLHRAGVKKHLVYFTVKCDVPLYGEELILQENEVVGYLRSGVFAYALDCNIGCGYVNSTTVMNGVFAIERMGVQYPAECHVMSPFDLKFERMKGRYCSRLQNMLYSLLKKL